jgi:hypothetical protein
MRNKNNRYFITLVIIIIIIIIVIIWGDFGTGAKRISCTPEARARWRPTVKDSWGLRQQQPIKGEYGALED